ncbi:MAG: protein translocase subunit SecF [Candidatus Gracilibacteria bacterium]|nr:protein translocase subunit SecF [Candidatus Gracilibacteria bacterium]
MDIVKNSKIYVGISAFFVLISLFLLIFGKLNLGIDMTGGIQMEYSYEKNIEIPKLKEEVKKLETEMNTELGGVINHTSVYGITGEQSLAVVVGFNNSIDAKKIDEYKEKMRSDILDVLTKSDESITESQYINIGKSFGDYIKNTAFLTLGIAIIAIALYVMHAFSGAVSGISIISFAVITIITLFHDVMISTGLYILTSYHFAEFQIDTFFITALLTILGYSINDTIVVFDRIRSNLKQFAGKKGNEGKELYEIVNISISETIIRSLYTSVTLLFVLGTIFFFGPESISGFVLVMIFGTIIGTYSSIFIASPLLYLANKNRKLSLYKKIVISPEDKIVV